jgi:hypothetical protein
VSELRRWSESGATPDEISLIQALRRDCAPPHLQGKTLKALGVAAAVGSAATAANAAAMTATATKGGLGALAKVLAVSLLGGGIVLGGAMVERRLHTERPASLPQSGVTTSPKTGPTSPVEAPAVEPPSPEPSLDTRAHVPVSAPAPSASAGASSKDRLSRELRALELAERALAERAPDTALRLLDNYNAKFPGGSLASEAMVLRARALLMRGNVAGAQDLADTYSAAHPDSPYAQRLEDLVHGRRSLDGAPGAREHR